MHISATSKNSLIIRGIALMVAFITLSDLLPDNSNQSDINWPHVEPVTLRCDQENVIFVFKIDS